MKKITIKYLNSDSNILSHVDETQSSNGTKGILNIEIQAKRYFKKPYFICDGLNSKHIFFWENVIYIHIEDCDCIKCIKK